MANTSNDLARPNARDALEIAHGMLTVIEMGGSFSTETWDERMLKIERALGKETARTRAAILAQVIRG